MFRVTESCFIEIGWDFLKRRGLSQNLYLHKTLRALQTTPLRCFVANATKYSPSVFKFMQGVNKDKCAVRFDRTELFLAIRKYEATEQPRMKR